jgi:predicted anti-sigma-YlaC factor YlaD
MLRCDQVARELSDAIDGEAPRARRLLIRLHLLVCGKCRRMETALRRTRELLGRLADEPARLEPDEP